MPDLFFMEPQEKPFSYGGRVPGAGRGSIPEVPMRGTQPAAACPGPGGVSRQPPRTLWHQPHRKPAPLQPSGRSSRLAVMTRFSGSFPACDAHAFFSLLWVTHIYFFLEEEEK